MDAPATLPLAHCADALQIAHGRKVSTLLAGDGVLTIRCSGQTGHTPDNARAYVLRTDLLPCQLACFPLPHRGRAAGMRWLEGAAVVWKVSTAR